MLEKEEMELLIDLKEIGQHKRNILSIVLKVIVIIFTLFILCQIILGFINFNRLYNNKEPYLVLKTKENINGVEYEKVYYFGLYKIILLDNDDESSIKLKIWFQDN